MKEVKIEKCPYCGGEELVDCRVESYGGAYLSSGGFKNAALYATVCRDCGSVVRNYCKTPEKLYPRKERRN